MYYATCKNFKKIIVPFIRQAIKFYFNYISFQILYTHCCNCSFNCSTVADKEFKFASSCRNLSAHPLSSLNFCSFSKRSRSNC